MSGEPSKPLPGPDEANTPTREAIEAQLNRILGFESFLNSGRLKSFLTFVVNQHLDGNGDQLKETSIAVSLF